MKAGIVTQRKEKAMKKILVMFHPLMEDDEYIRSGGTQFAPHHFWCYDQLKKTGYQVEYLRTDTGPTLWNRIGNIFGINLLQQQIDCLRRAAKFDLIFVPFMEFSFLIAMLKAFGLYRKPVISIAHFAYVPSKRNRLKRWKEQLVRWVYFSGTDKILHYNRPLYEKGKSYASTGNVSFVDHWGIDVDFFREYVQAQEEPAQETYMYTTGGSARDFPTLIKAFRTLPTKLKITTVGHFEDDPDCPITPNIQIDNSLPFGLGSTGIIRKDYYHALAVAIPLLQTKDPEPFGITVLMEALAMGKPVIVSDNPGYPFDVEEEGVGIKVPYGDVIAWREAVQYLQSHPEEARQMGQRGLKLMQEKYNYCLFCRGVNRQVLQLLPKNQTSHSKVEVFEKDSVVSY